MTKGSKPAPDIAYYDNGGVRYRGKQIGIWRTLDRGGRVVKETRFSSI